MKTSPKFSVTIVFLCLLSLSGWTGQATAENRTAFAQAMPEQYKCKDPVQAYRNFYLGEKIGLFQWTKRKTPFWITEKTRKNANSIAFLQLRSSA